MLNSSITMGYNKNIKPIDPAIRNIANKTILFTNARNEKNMKEWAAHHLLLGFDKIYIFDHKSTKPLQNEFSHFDKRVIVERCNMDNPVKLTLLKRALIIAQSAGADWMLYLDADEFLILNTFSNIKLLLKSFHYADALAINWLCFGSNHHIKDPAGLILDNYTKSDLLVDQHVKTFVRPSQVMYVDNPHFYKIKDSTRNITIDNKIVPMGPFNKINMEYNKLHAYIAHYINQSEESYMNRKVLLPTDHTNVFRGVDREIHTKHNNVDNFGPKEKYSSKVQKFLDYYANK